jgi:hypothetical protein
MFTTCWLNRHTPADRTAKWDGEHYYGTCGKCGRRIRRLRKGVWKRDWLNDDAKATRG